MRTAAQPSERARSVGRSVVAVNAATPLVRITENARVLMNRWTGEWIFFVSNLSGVGGQSHPTTIDVGSLANPLGQEEPTG
jgi:pheromone shutdown protein TraB